MKYKNLADVTGKVLATPGGGDFLSRLHNSILAFRDVLKIARDLQGEGGHADHGDGEGGPGFVPLGNKLTPGPVANAPKLPQGQHPLISKFLEEYGDTTVEAALAALGPMTVKQIWGMIQHGIRPKE